MTEEHEVPNHRCGFELESDIELVEWALVGNVCCWRQTWRDTDRCVWHAKVENKPIEKLESARADGPERLDGAYLVGVEASDNLSFRKCVLRSADFTDGNFSHVCFYRARLPEAKFYNVDLSHTQFHYSDLLNSMFSHSKLTNTQFHGALPTEVWFNDVHLFNAKFHNANLSATKFHNITEPRPVKMLMRAWFNWDSGSRCEFHDADLSNVEFRNSEVFDMEFHNADLSGARFHDTNLSGAEFYDADLTDADCTDVNARNPNFTHAILHDTLLTRADIRGATFTNALLYEAVFTDSRINSQTTFYKPEATFYDSITSKPAVVYEENPHTSDDLPENIHRLEAAEWVYRRLEKLHDENALSENARNFHISKEEVRRKYQRESGEYARYAVSTFQWYVTGHGESIPRIFGSAALLILVSGILYPLVGGFESSSTGAAYRIPLTELHQVVSFDGMATLLQGIYFSVITFTTIGYGDLYPTGVGSKLLVGFESLSGAILIALFVFVLGRRVTR